MRTTITTWADAFGNWHATVETREPDDRTTQALARAAILGELRAREGDKIDARRLRVKAVDRLVTTTKLVSTDYVEAWQGERS